MRKSTWWSWLKNIGNGDATKIFKNEKRNIYLSVKLMKMIHNQGWHKENRMHVCLFVCFWNKNKRTMRTTNKNEEEKYIWKIQKKMRKKTLTHLPKTLTRNETRFLKQTSFVWFLTLLKKWTWVWFHCFWNLEIRGWFSIQFLELDLTLVSIPT